MRRICAVLGGKLGDEALVTCLNKDFCFEKILVIGNEVPQFTHPNMEHINIDYSCITDVREFLSKKNILNVIPGCNDFGYEVACQLNRISPNGSPHFNNKISKILHNKWNFFLFAKKYSISVPKTYVIKQNQVEDFGLTYPLLIKPSKLSGGKGILLVKSRAELQSLLEKNINNTKAGVQMIQQFIAGSNHGFFSLIENGRLSFFSIDSEYYYSDKKYIVGGSIAPATLEPLIIEKVKKNAEKIIKYLDLRNGILHFQFLKKGKSIFIIDVMRRAPGDMYFDFIKLTYGVNAVVHYVKQFLEKDNTFVGQDRFTTTEEKKRRVYRHIIFSSNSRANMRYSIKKEFKDSIIYEKYVCSEWRKKYENFGQKVGVLFFDADKIQVPEILTQGWFEKIE